MTWWLLSRTPKGSTLWPPAVLTSPLGRSFLVFRRCQVGFGFQARKTRIFDMRDKKVSWAVGFGNETWDLDSFEVVTTLDGHTDDIIGLQLRTRNGMAQVAVFPTCDPWMNVTLQVLTIHRRGFKPSELHWATDANSVATKAFGDRIRWWVQKPRLVKSVALHRFGPTNRHQIEANFTVKIGRQLRFILVYDTKTWKLLHRIDCKAQIFLTELGFLFFPDGRRIPSEIHACFCFFGISC